MMEAKPPESLSLQQEAANEKTPGSRLEELAATGIPLARRVASNPSAPPQLLARLAGSGDATTRKNVAANPNTPTEVLLNLGGEFPEEVLTNPVFPLLFLENIKILDEIPITTLRNLLKQEQVPVSFLEWAAHSSDIELKLAVGMNAQTPLEVLNKLSGSPQPQVAEAARLHVNWAGEMRGDAWDEAAHAAIKIAAFPKPNSSYLGEYALDRSRENSGIPASIHRLISESGETLESVLARLGNSADTNVRYLVARTPGAPANLLAQLAQDGCDDIRKAVARNPSTPAALLRRLSGDPSPNVRRLARDMALLRYYIYKPDRLPAKLLEPALENYMQYSATSLARFCLLHHPKTSARVLEESCRSLFWRERCAVANNPKTPVRALKILAGDGNRIVRAGAGCNLERRSQQLC